MVFGIKSPISIRSEFDSEPIYYKSYLKTKRKYYNDQATDFGDKEMLKVGSNYTCLATVLINFVLKKDENYYLEECKCVQKEKNVVKYITRNLYDLEISYNNFCWKIN